MQVANCSSLLTYCNFNFASVNVATKRNDASLCRTVEWSVAVHTAMLCCTHTNMDVNRLFYSFNSLISWCLSSVSGPSNTNHKAVIQVFTTVCVFQQQILFVWEIVYCSVLCFLDSFSECVSSFTERQVFLATWKDIPNDNESQFQIKDCHLNSGNGGSKENLWKNSLTLCSYLLKLLFVK